MKTKVVYVKSTFPSDIDSVFKLLTDVKTLQYIASPYASFKIIGEDKELVWKEGQTFSFLFKMFCFIPYGTHTIKVINFNKDGIYTNESNTHVPIWNHRIKLIDNGIIVMKLKLEQVGKHLLFGFGLIVFIDIVKENG